jgi:hypothetical protein
MVRITTAATDARSLGPESFAALKRGDASAARELLTRVVQAGDGNAAVRFAIAAAHRQLDSMALDGLVPSPPVDLSFVYA